MARIGVLTTSYPRFSDDAAGLFVRGMARALRDRGHSLEVLAPADARGEPEQEPGIELRWVRYAPRGLTRTFYGAGVPDNVRRDPLAWPGLIGFPAALLADARRRAPSWDAVISHWALPCGAVASMVRGGRPHLAVLHSADVHLLRRLPGRSLWARRLAAGADAMLFASASLRAELLSWLPATAGAQAGGRCHASAMGVEAVPPSADRRALRRRLGLGRFAVLALGRLVPVKGLDVAVRALDGVDGAELVVAGEGPLRRELEELARARGVEARFVGTLSGQDKTDWMHAAHAFVLPSVRLASGRTEGTPAALLEAAQAALPIVASEVGGVPEVLTHDRSALLVPPGDAGALRRALVRLRDDRNLRRRLGRAAHTVGKRYRWPKLIEPIEALLFGQR